MKFTEDTRSPQTVRRVEPGKVCVGETTFAEDLVLRSDNVVTGWQAKDLDSISADDLAPHIAADTEIVLLGTGWGNAAPPRGLVFELARRQVGFESMDTPAACRTFNILLSEGRRVVAFLKVAR